MAHGHAYSPLTRERHAGEPLGTYPLRWQYANTSCVPRGSAPVPRLQSAGGTCAHRCGMFDKSAPCQCNGGCGAYGDCCADYAAQCANPVQCMGDACCSPNDYTQSGNATLGFSLVNMREDFVFVLVQESFQYPAVAAVSGAVGFAHEVRSHWHACTAEWCLPPLPPLAPAPWRSWHCGPSPCPPPLACAHPRACRLCARVTACACACAGAGRGCQRQEHARTRVRARTAHRG